MMKLIVRAFNIIAFKSIMSHSSRQKVNIRAKIINKIKMINIIKNLALIKKHTKSNSIRWMPKIKKKIRISSKNRLKKERLVATISKKDHKFAMYVR
jgi:hypothetical protein